uniref:Ig-like domain-containing protein n=1 Tax=Maylandia zebra TaxID=106582 RepID=A0A3P9D9I8_9CICH
GITGNTNTAVLHVHFFGGEFDVHTDSSGQDVTLPCRVTNNITAVEWSRAGLGQKNVFLYQDGRFVPNNQGMKDGDASLILKKVTTADSGTYKCRVKIAETGSWKYVTINLKVSPGE